MKFTLNRDELLISLQQIQSVVEKKNTTQILSNILCNVQKNVLTLSATDSEVGIRISLPIEEAVDGRVTISAKNFFDIVKELPSQKLRVSKKNNDWIEIICGKSKFNIVGLSADQYPELPLFEEKNYIDARVDALLNMINKTSFAVSTDATRYHLNGVFFEHIENNVMRMVATDGHRLSFVDQEVFLKPPELKRGIIIPRKGLAEMKKLLDQNHNTIGMAFEKGYIFMKTGDSYLFVRLIEGEYPDYKQVIPKGIDIAARVRNSDFVAALRRASVLAHEKSRGVKMVFQKGQLMLSSSNPDMGEVTEELDLDYTGEPIEIGFNAKYLLDCLPMIQSNNLEIKIRDRLSPGILQGVDQKNHTYIIMPMRI